MNLYEAMIKMRNGYAVKNTRTGIVYEDEENNGKICPEGITLFSTEDMFRDEWIYAEEEPNLTDAEREYLKSVIENLNITEIDDVYKDDDGITIEYKKVGYKEIPFNGHEFKAMRKNYCYTLEALGLVL